MRYIVLREDDTKKCFAELLTEMIFLDEHPGTETTFLIFPADFSVFSEYLDMMEGAEQFLADENYEGIYQVASFHPLYIFAGAGNDDAANYTNRSVYPMIHILREDSITAALKNFKNPGGIPDNNIAFAEDKGLRYMQLLRESCFRINE